MMASKESPTTPDPDPFCSSTPATGSLQNKPSPKRIHHQNIRGVENVAMAGRGEGER